MKIQHIIPAVIPESVDHLQARLMPIRGVAHRVQIDVMDGSYAPPVSWPYDGVSRKVFEAIRRKDDGLPYWQDFDFEIDLLVMRPEERIEEWALAGAKCLIVHVETTEKLEEIVEECHTRRLEVALAMKPSTDIDVLAPYVDRALFVQCMGNDRVGYHGVSLHESVFDKVRAIRKRWPSLMVSIDIGVSEQTIPELYDAGVRRFAAGSAIFARGEPVEAYKELDALVEKQHDTGK